MSFYINEALKVLPEEIKLEALKNHYDYANSETGKRIQIVHTKVGSLSQALAEGFIWKETPQGFLYWNEIYTKQILLEQQVQKTIKQQLNKLN